MPSSSFCELPTTAVVAPVRQAAATAFPNLHSDTFENRRRRTSRRRRTRLGGKTVCSGSAARPAHQRHSTKLDSPTRTPTGGKRPSSPPDPPQPSPRRARFDLPAFTDVTDNHSTRSNSPEPLSTPTLSESYRGLRKNLSFKSLRELEVREFQTAVWRKGGRGEPGEERYRPKNLDELLVHAARGGMREYASSGRCGESELTLAVLLSRIVLARVLAPCWSQLARSGLASDQEEVSTLQAAAEGRT